ncbi:CG6619 [Drosophila busckii]|uniref:CG6619 n=1 Tax=Drosophila busckii TaxID=30019 RepID=A0A0M3QW62_DROBS|nr:CG6619 [Drosophila busckii]
MARPMSTSCQSIATAASSAATTAAAVSISASNATSVGSLIAAACMQQPPASLYVNGTGSLGRLKFHHKSLDASDEELEYAQLSQSTHILGRYKSERLLASKPDEDRRRRTIIVEKKHDSYGFTLQSYGIHYKRDEELEMITYVDYVEYGGPAYRSGMREGDVILSINGHDLEKADHKTIVDFIKQCDMRMRMVVLFEDCVRKVDLHMRYIQLQSLLQQKMNELERVHMRERELLEGKWKTHSLPARKKANANASPSDGEGASPTEAAALEASFYRPALSTEDVGQLVTRPQAVIIPPPAQFMLTYHYLDPTYRYVLRPTHASSEEFIDASNNEQPSSQRYILQRTESGDTSTTTPNTQQYHSTSAGAGVAKGKPPAPPPRSCEKHKPPAKPPKLEKSKSHCHAGHSCNPCLGHFRWKSAEKSNNNADNVSLDAYDLASPCCATHEFAPADSASYTTSISTDTLFWDPKSDTTQAQASRQHSTKSRQSYEQQQQPQLPPQPQPHPHVHAHHHHLQRYHVTATQVQPSQIYPNTMAYVQKPKSWDNLATKGLVGPSFGYGYLDTVAVKPPVKMQIAQQRHSMPRRNPYGRYSTYGDVENYAPPPTEFVGELTTTTTTTITAKSTEQVLATCDCLTPQQQQALKAAQYQLSQSQKLTHQNSCQMGYYSHLPRPTTDVGTSTIQQQQQQAQPNGGCDGAVISEATRL